MPMMHSPFCPALLVHVPDGAVDVSESMVNTSYNSYFSTKTLRRI